MTYDAYVAAVGGTPVSLGSDIYSVDIAAAPDGSTLRAMTQGATGTRYWTIDTTTMAATEQASPGGSVDIIDSDAGGIYEVSRQDGEALTLTVPDLQPVTLDPSAWAGAATARGAAGARTWYVGGGAYATSTAMLWSYDEATGEEATPVVLGPDGDPDEGVLDVAASPTSDAVYTLSIQDHDGSPQTYGLSVVEGEQETYYPLSGLASRLAVSADGDTLYVSQGSGVLALDTAHLVANPDSVDTVRSAYIESGSWISDLVTDPTGHLLAAAGDQVYSFGSPSTVSGFSYDTSADDPSYAGIRWHAPTTTGGVSANELTYFVTVTDRAGGKVREARSFSTDADFDHLVAGHTYDVQVIVDNGLFRGPAGTSSFTAPTSMTKPTSIAVKGAARVGSTLSVKSSGSWTAGTKLAYRWTANGAKVSTAAKLVVPASLLGKKIVVAVTGTLGESRSTVTSRPTAKVTRKH